AGRWRRRRGAPRGDSLFPEDADMNALLEPEAELAPCTETLSQINESPEAGERLLTASAKASRVLLEAPVVRAAIPGVLALIGEAARVDRVNLMEARRGPAGERLATIVSEWSASSGVTHGPGTEPGCTCDERDFAQMCAELRAGRSVCFNREAGYLGGIEGIGTRTKAIVPIFVDGEFTGVVGFDNTRLRRDIDASELA